MSESNYIIATNKAYETLMQFHEFSFPICIFNVVRQIKGIKLYTYSEFAKRHNLSFKEFYELAPSNFGFTIINPPTKKHLIIYNEQKDEPIIRFTLAHELGHIILGHTKDNESENREANCFARNYLCPIPAVIEMGLKTTNDYMECFYVSEPMAEFAIDFKNCDYKNITTSNYNNYNDNVFCYMSGVSLSELYGYQM